jgi:xanthine/CO dehydrogenase XdhC/CoxF family maturation factor
MALKEELGIYEAWAQAGKSVAVATVFEVVGSAPRPEGARLLVSSDGDVKIDTGQSSVESPRSVLVQLTR